MFIERLRNITHDAPFPIVPMITRRARAEPAANTPTSELPARRTDKYADKLAACKPAAVTGQTSREPR